MSTNDVILGVGGKPFDGDARIQLANAITAAETKRGGGVLRLIRWRANSSLQHAGPEVVAAPDKAWHSNSWAFSESGHRLSAAATVLQQTASPSTLLRAGETAEVELKLKVLGTYSDTAPYDCPKSKAIFEQGCQLIAKNKMESGGYAGGIPGSKGHEGSVWEHPCHCTRIEDGRHLLNCLRYVDRAKSTV